MSSNDGGSAVSEEVVKVKDPSTPNRVSFRQDVTFGNNGVAAVSARSALSSASSDDNTNNSSSAPSHNKKSYTQLRSKLTREQKSNRDPFYFYQVTRNLGQGSMGDVKLVKKRPDKVGGSARRDLQAAVARQKQKERCFRIPILGSVLKICVDGTLTDELTEPNGAADVSRHSAFSFMSSKSLGKDEVTTQSTLSAARSFEDSLVESTGPSQEIIYAMKSILLQQLGDQTYIDELRNEIALLRDLDHPNIVRAMETFEYRGKISIVMELCSGGDLYVRDPYTEAEAARILSSILSAVAYMHSRNVVHRDLKFENVLFVNTSPLSDVKLIDFGLSKVYHHNKHKMADIVGTVYTMAPEVIMGDYTEKADMWAIGVIAFMLLSSSMPYYGKDRVHVIKRILNNKYHMKAKRWKTVSDQAKAFVQELLVTELDDRPDAESALGSAWLNSMRADGAKLSNAEEEQMAQAAMLRYAGYIKLKKMALMVVAHKSSAQEIGTLRKLFKKYDAGRRGSIGFEEFCSAMRGTGHSKDQLRYVFDAMDLAGSGRVGYTEFIAATVEAHGTIIEARLAEAFDHLDDDDDGFITYDDLVHVLGHDAPHTEIETIIAEANLTKDNKVSYSEYMALWETEQTVSDDKRFLSSELSSITVESFDSKNEEAEARAGFLQAKHHQNTLHTWAMEMQLPAQEFARGCSFLHQVALGDVPGLGSMLADRPSLVNFRDYDRRTALHIAASEGLVDVCQFLIAKGARVNRADRWGGFPLDDAHRHGRADVVNLLREHKAKFGNTSKTSNLITAASKGDVEEVKALLEFGSMDLNQGDYDHRTALHLAANEGHLHVVELLCNAGANINVKDRWGDQPLDDARKAKKNSAAIVAVLSGATSDSVRSTAEPAPTMDTLTNKPAQQSALLEILAGEDEGMEQLPVQEFSMGCSVLHQAALGNKIVLQQILQERPDLVNFRDYDRRTPLHLAASEGQVEICEFLVKRGAKINRVDRWGGSALDDAHRHKYVDVVKLLRSNGAKFGSTSQGTNFITAAAEGDKEELEAFLEFGTVDIDQGDYDKRTALHLAAGEGHLEIVLMLCEAGADVNVEDRWGHRPLDEAGHAKTHSEEIMQVLLKHGANSNNMLTKIKKAFLGISGTKR